MAMNLILYGDLKHEEQQKTNKGSSPLKINISNSEINTVYDVLEKLNIEENKVSHIFVNHNYCGPGKEIKEGDRVALFPKRMALIFVEIPQSNSIEVRVKLSADLRKYGPEESIIAIPEGSTLITIFKKYNITKEERNLTTLINGIACHDKQCVLKRGDVVSLKI
ncbi:MAG: MoaD/ThiS family protein [Promethearchaeota archaeon]|jgi:molybdopterin converting factor small subunit